jgi:hypothetical protein
MPEIRSITYFANLSPQSAESTLEAAGTFGQAATQAFTGAGHIVQSRRFASQPFPQGLASNGPANLVEDAQRLFSICERENINYLALGPVGANDDPAYVDAIADIFRHQPSVFASVNIADPENGISLPLLAKTADLIRALSQITPDGMTNLYLTAIANCPAGSPFFPVAYHDGGEPSFALAIQAADLAVQAFNAATSPEDARQRLTDAIQHTADLLTPIATELSKTFGIRFGGLDFSLAPFPEDTQSLGGALEALGPHFGGAGLVASASLIMNAVEAADFPRAGFCGLMLPILEDSVLAARAAEGRLTMNDLLLLSAVCGTGLDCIPLPGDIASDVLRDILLDVAALALRLDKPLTARLMPFPDKQAGDPLTFDFPYFANSRVLAAPQSASHARVFGAHNTDAFHISPRQKPDNFS